MSKLRLGVIGAGSWATSQLLPVLQTRGDEVDFLAVSRIGEDELDRVKRRFGFARASTDYRDVVDAGLDICVVATPAALHHEQAKAALEAGAHVLLEKPVTLSSEEAWDLVALAERNDRHLLISFGWNYRPMARVAKEMFERHGIGAVEQLSITMSSGTRDLFMGRATYPDANPEMVPDVRTWADPALSGGGYGQAQLSHALGLSLWLTGLRGSEAFGVMASPGGREVEFHDAIALRFDNGAIGTIGGGSAHTGARADKHQLEVRAIGSDGQFHFDVEREMVWMFRAPDEDIEYHPEPNEGAYECSGPPNALVDLALGRPVENCSPGELGARTVEILEACYRSARSRAIEPVAPRAGG